MCCVILEKLTFLFQFSQKYFKYLYSIDFLILKSIPLFLLKIENTGTHIMDNHGPGDVIIMASTIGFNYLGVEACSQTKRPITQAPVTSVKSSISKREACPDL